MLGEFAFADPQRLDRARHRGTAQTARATKPLADEAQRLEREIEEVEQRLADVERRLTLPEVYGDPAAAGALARERRELEEKAESLTGRWEEVSLELEELRAELEAGGAA